MCQPGTAHAPQTALQPPRLNPPVHVVTTCTPNGLPHAANPQTLRGSPFTCPRPALACPHTPTCTRQPHQPQPNPQTPGRRPVCPSTHRSPRSPVPAPGTARRCSPGSRRGAGPPRTDSRLPRSPSPRQPHGGGDRGHGWGRRAGGEGIPFPQVSRCRRSRDSPGLRGQEKPARCLLPALPSPPLPASLPPAPPGSTHPWSPLLLPRETGVTAAPAHIWKPSGPFPNPLAAPGR